MLSRILAACPLALLACASTPKPAPAAAGAQSAAGAQPFFEESALPLHYPPFDRIHDSDYVPAFEAGMAEHLREAQAVARDSAAPTFENTFVPLEKSGRLLHRVQTVFNALSSANTDPAMQKIEAEMAPRLAAHRDQILLDPALFARVDGLYQKRAALGLDPESVQLIERY